MLILELNGMTDFDAIYEDEPVDLDVPEETNVALVPEPIVIRGAGNMTV